VLCVHSEASGRGRFRNQIAGLDLRYPDVSLLMASIMLSRIFIHVDAAVGYQSLKSSGIVFYKN